MANAIYIEIITGVWEHPAVYARGPQAVRLLRSVDRFLDRSSFCTGPGHTYATMHCSRVKAFIAFVEKNGTEVIDTRNPLQKLLAA